MAVCFRLPAKKYDALYARSQRDRVTVADRLRKMVDDDADRDDDDD